MCLYIQTLYYNQWPFLVILHILIEETGDTMAKANQNNEEIR